MNTENPPVLVDEDIILAQTHRHRERIVQVMTTAQDGTFRLPEDPAEKKIVVSVLKDMDAAALGRKRIKVEEKANDQLAGSSALIAKLLEQSAHRLAGHKVPAGASREAPVLGSEIPPPRLVEGETAAVGASESYESFVARTSGDVGAMPGSTTD